MIGETISHYHILAKLGEGGMGVVYRALDTTLDREVAIKVLPESVAVDPERLARFEREAKAVAALNHPNIVTLYSVEEADGAHFITMELVAGETLSELLTSEGFSLDQFFDLAIPLADAVNSAHSKGVVHRDLKPANIMMDQEGRLKVLDFGLAKLFDPNIDRSIPDDRATVDLTSSSTVTGRILGTANYMSPEQADGKPVDHRADFFSLGVILYEMITGQRPFKGDGPASTISSVLRDTPTPVTDLRPALPNHLGRIIARCLDKQAARRYQSALDLKIDLEELKRETESSQLSDGSGTRVGVSESPPRSKRSWFAGVALVTLVVVALGYWQLRSGSMSPNTGGDPTRTMIVVLPFENLGPEGEEYFADGITDAITARLASIKELGVISRQSAIQYKGTDKSIRQIGDELGVDYILEGTIQREKPGDPASRVRVIPQLVRVSDDTHVWATTYDENMVEVFRVQSDIAERVATQLDIALLATEREAVEKSPTENLDAYDYYLRGIDYSRRYRLADTEAAVQYLRRATSLDPEFAEAWSQLAMVYHFLYWFYGRPGVLPLETEAANRAHELAPDLSDTRLALGWVDYANRRFDGALAHFEAAQSIRPGAHALRSIGFTLRRLGRWQEAIARFEEARQLDPRDYGVYFDGFGNTCSPMRRFDEAERYLDRAIALKPDLVDAYMGKVYVLIARNGDVGAAKQVLLQIPRQSDIAELGQGLISTHLIRLFPEFYAEALDAFASEPHERIRQIHPAIIALAYLSRALVFDTMQDQHAATAQYDSARVHFENIIRSNPQSAYVSHYHGDLGIAYAGLDRTADAIEQGNIAVRMIPIAKDAIVGTDVLKYMAEIYAMCGEYEAAIDRLETLLSVPSRVSVGLLRVDPLWDPVRGNPRFQRLLDKHSN